MDIQEIEKNVEAGYISKRKHPHKDLYIFNYTKLAQYDWVWNHATIICRGLIVDGNYNIVGRPFKKFFSLEQLDSLRNHAHHLYGIKYKEIPKKPFKVFEKLDGSLLIVYNYDGKWETATRGSFESEQAIKGKELLGRYDTSVLDPSKTYLFEVIYPENRIVVNYGDEEKLVLLAAVDTATGNEVPFDQLPKIFPLPEVYDYNNLHELSKFIKDDQEGFVLVYEDGFRLKVKGEEYKRLHKLLTGINERHIWERLSLGLSINDLIERVPDEHYKWVEETRNNLNSQYNFVLDSASREYKLCKERNWSKKDVALNLDGYDYIHVIFAMYNGKPYKQIIWNMIKPVPEKEIKIYA